MSRKAHVLVVDDEAYVRESLAALLTRRGFEVRTASSAEDALSGAASSPTDAVVSDLLMPGGDGLELLRLLGREAPHVPVIVLTGHGTVASAVACMKEGAFDYLEKPADPEALALGVQRAVAWSGMRREVEILRRTAADDEGEPIGRSPAWLQTMTLVEAAAGSDSTVLLTGESGSGKEVLARQVHRRSRRADGPFVPVNCAAIPGDLFESEFFGHRRGAFTGALEDREGRFRLAHGGTMFLDEVSCLPPPAQAKLLRVLQDRSFQRVGDSRTQHADVRVVSASNQDLSVEVEAGRFRKDLLYRLDVFRIRVPPLRERREDVPLLAARFLDLFARRENRPVRAISPEALRLLVEYDWPGNVRELENVLERAVILEPTGVLRPASLPFSVGPAGLPASGRGAAGDLPLRECVLRAEREALEEALRRSGGVKGEAARLLGVDPRNLSYYLRKHGIQG